MIRESGGFAEAGSVFISYAREDRSYVCALAEDLRREGFTPWYDARLTAGCAWVAELEQAIREADAVLVVVTPEGAASTFIRKEIQFAQAIGKPIIPFLLRDTELPLLVADLQYLDARIAPPPLAELREMVAKRRKAYQLSGSGILPRLPTMLIGRNREIQELLELIVTHPGRLITVTGGPGIGKTRLALEVAAHLFQAFPGGCRFADLAESRNLDEVCRSVASALSIPLVGKGRSNSLVADALEIRDPLLLVLDNFEQVAEISAETIGLWRDRAPKVHFLVTSRCLLRLSGELEYILSPLPVPHSSDTPEKIECTESVCLFVARALEVSPGISFGEDALRAVARICMDLEGIPLAIELAAARTRVLTPQQIAQMCGQKFRILRSNQRDLPARHQTLFSAIDWSCSLLTELEKTTLSQLCVFRGGFFLHSAEAILNRSSAAEEVIDTIQSLREKSLITTRSTRFGVRYGIYVAIREFCEEKFSDARSVDSNHELVPRHIEHFLSLVETLNPLLCGQTCEEALDHLELERENVFISQERAVEACSSETAARLILGISEFMKVRGPSDQRVPRLLSVLGACARDSQKLQSRLLIELSEAFQDAGDWDAACRSADEAVAITTLSGQSHLHAGSLLQKGRMHRLRGFNSEALELLAEARNIYLENGDTQGALRAQALEGVTLKYMGDFHLALKCLGEAEARARILNNQRILAEILNGKGLVQEEVDEYDAALSSLSEAESIVRVLGDTWRLAGIISNRGIVLLSLGMTDGALAAFRDAEKINREVGNKWWLAANLHNRGNALHLHGRGEMDEALSCFEAAEFINRQLGNRDFLTKNIRGRASMFRELGDIERATSCLDEAEQIARDIGSRNDIGHGLVLRAQLAGDLAQLDRALEVLTQAKEIFLAIGNRNAVATCVGETGRIFIRLGRIREGRRALAQALREKTAIRSGGPTVFVYQVEMARIGELMGNAANARKWAKRALELGMRRGYSIEHGPTEIREAMRAANRIAS